MSMPNKELRAWLATIPEDAFIGIDEGGLTLVVEGDPVPYCEIGGLVVDDDDTGDAQ